LILDKNISYDNLQNLSFFSFEKLHFRKI